MLPINLNSSKNKYNKKKIIMKPSFGEVFVTNDILNGGIENIKLFKGKLISSICGGCRKIYIIEEG